MNSATIPILVALAVQSALGLVVFQSNPKRKSNQCFLLLTFVTIGWLVSLYFAFTATTTVAAEWAIREASVGGVLILGVLNLLRLSIRESGKRWRTILSYSRTWIILSAVIIVFCQTKYFLEGARMTHSAEISSPEPIYGSLGFIYVLYFAGAAVVLITGSLRDLRKTAGAQHAELSFVLIGGILVVVVPILLGIVLLFFVDRSRVLWLAPFRVILFNLVVAYGIATRKIMEVGIFLRRAMSYIVLTAYLLALYGVVWWLVASVIGPEWSAGKPIAHVAAAVAIAFAMAPARGVSQALADRLFIKTRGLDFRSTMSKAAAILESVTTLDDLLARFAKTISEAVGTDRVFILLLHRDRFVQRYPIPQTGARSISIELGRDHAIISHLENTQQPIVLEELHRIRSTAESERVMKQMESIEMGVAMGIFSRAHLAGVMLLGPRVSGRIYGTVEQNALQVLCGQLAVAINNAELFTEVQNAKIYNDILLQNLTTGVIAADADGQITVFNSEAEEITELKAGDIIDRHLGHLPGPLQEVLRETLASAERQENRELVLRKSADGGLIVRASSSVFHAQDGQVLGALMVLTDVTALKRLELQIRRSDRLASLGTLSAGMAHEIKNPLVSIKTFAQLLPERYQDSDFRETFSNLIGHEIDRIDSLVNQLLRFARPAKPFLKPMHVHDVLEKSLMLVGHRLYQKEIKLSRSWKADVDTIRADADQLEQVFLNFFLNAMEAMKRGGELTVATEIRGAEEWVSSAAGSNGDVHGVLRITIRDNGEGIRSEDIPHVFDPFFTTKDYGTGLGLSVVHGIIQEHGGQIEVESELSKGTAFHILLPLERSDREVAAA